MRRAASTSDRPCAIYYRGIQRFHFIERFIPRQFARNFWASGAQPITKRIVVEKSSEGFGECDAVVRDDQAGAIFHKRRDAAGIGDEYRSATCYGFSGGVAEILVLRRQDEEIRISIGGPLGVTIKRAREQDRVAQSKLRRFQFERPVIVILFVRTGDDENPGPIATGVVAPIRERRKRQFRAFLFYETPEKQDDLRIRCDIPLLAERAGVWQRCGAIDPVAAHDDLGRRDAAGL